MIRTSFITAVAAAAGWLLSTTAAGAQAKCDVSVEPVLSQWEIRYNPLEDPAAFRSFDLWLDNKGTTPCNGDLQVSLNGEPFGLTRSDGRGGVDYSLRLADGRNANVTPSSGVSVNLPGEGLHLAAGERRLIRLDFQALPGDAVAAGRYAQTAHLSFVRQNNDVFGGAPVVLLLDVVPAAVIGLKGEFTRLQGTPVIDLGELTQGPRLLPTSLYVHSTSAYRISIASANQGRLVQGKSGWNVDYSLRVGTMDIDLKGTSLINETSQQIHRDDYPLSIHIGDVRGKRAGEYSDVLTFTVTAI